MLDSRPRGRGFEAHRRHCVVVIEQDTFFLARYWFKPRKTRPCLTERLLMGRKESNQTNKQIHIFLQRQLLCVCVCVRERERERERKREREREIVSKVLIGEKIYWDNVRGG